MIKKIQPKVFSDITPTINENIASGYSIGTIWHDNITGIEYTHSLDGIWKSNVKVNSDWNATSGEAQILNKPSTYTPSAHDHAEEVLRPDVVEFQSTPPTPSIAGSMYYDETYKVLSTVLGNGVILQNGLEMYVRVVNKTGSQLNDGDVVYISGAQGNRPTATKAIATNEQTSYVIGVCTETISNNHQGFVTVFGTVNNFNTSTFTDGAKLYLSATTEGGLTMTRPVAPNHGVIVGIALNSTNNGAIFVNPNSGFELNELHDVNTSIEKTIPLNADYFLIWDTVVSYWKKVSKTYLNEVHIGDSAPLYNESIWIDTSAAVNTSFIATTGATITPNIANQLSKYTSNYASGNTVLVDFPTNPPVYDDINKALIIKNLKAADVTFVPSTGNNTVGAVTYTYFMMQIDPIDVPQNKRVELSYLYSFTSSTTCDVSIMYKVQE
jgi:hypothetical protein